MKGVSYRTKINAETLESLKKGIIRILLIEEKFKDTNYSAKQLAIDLNTNSRYLSAAINNGFRTNYNELVNNYRVNAALSLLENSENNSLSIENIGESVGFSSSQAFFKVFNNITKTTPLKYRKQSQRK